MTGTVGLVRQCVTADFDAMLSIINTAAEAYRGVIPEDRWHEPYMPADDLRAEIAAGVKFTGVEADGGLTAIMGIQAVRNVRLIRRTNKRSVQTRRQSGHSVANATSQQRLGGVSSTGVMIIALSQLGDASSPPNV